MHKLIYIYPGIINDNFSDGVNKKIWQQFHEMNKKFDMYLIGYDDDGFILYHDNMNKKIRSNSSNIIHRKHFLYKLASETIRENKIGCVYIRYGYCDPVFLKLLKQIKGCKIILELPTYPYEAELDRSFKYRVVKVIDHLTRTHMKKYIAKIATFSKDKEIFSIPCINIMNGINVDSISIKKNEEFTELNLLAIASMVYWHGYDRLIEGMNEYYKNNGDQKIVLHLVGDGEEISKYKQLVSQYNLENNVIFHGFKSGDALNQLYDKCNIAIASLGMHRMNIFLASTLKTREYGAKGMPMVTSCEIDAFPSKECDFILKFPEDESNIDVNQIIEFYDDLMDKYKNAENLTQKIREETKDKCDMSIVMKPIIDYLKGD